MAKKTAAAGAATKELATIPSGRGELIDVKNYALINEPSALQAMVYNLQDEQISEFDLDRIKIPAGGGLFFNVPGEDGITPEKSIQGIVLHLGIRRSYWVNPTPTGSPPDCFSIGGLKGIGNPGGECANCPFNQFGSAVKSDGKQGKGKRCREMRVMLILRAQDRLPIVVLAPPASIKPVKQWLMKLPVFMFQAVIKLELSQDKNSDGVEYSKLVPSYVGHISPEAAKGLQAYAETLKKVIVGKAPIGSDFVAVDDDGGQILEHDAKAAAEALGGEEPAGDE